MIQKLIYVAAVGVMTMTLTACGSKGIDRKLNYSDTTKLFESYGEAILDALPEQQNVLRSRRDEIMGPALRLALTSNPAMVGAGLSSKKDVEEFERIKKMSLRELFISHLAGC